MLIFLGKISNFVNGWIGLTNFFPIIEIVKCTGRYLFIKSHQILIEIIIHHENIVVLFLTCIKFLLVISLVSSESVHH